MQPNGARRWLILSAALLALWVGLLYTPLGNWVAQGMNALQGELARLPDLLTQPDAERASAGSAAVRGLLIEGAALQKKGRPEEALDRYLQALRLDGRHPPTHAALGNVYLQLNRSDDALRALERAAALAPEDGAVLCQLGQLYLQRNNYEQSIVVLERARYATPEDPSIRLLLGTAYYYRARADSENAVQMLEQGAEVAPHDGDARFRLALAYMQRNDDGDSERAIGALLRSLELDPEQVEAYRYLGLLYLREGEKEAAIAAWRRYLDVGGDQQAMEQVREWLRTLEGKKGLP